MRKRARYARRNKFGSMLRTVRFSTRDGTNNCHYLVQGITTGSQVASTQFKLDDIAATSDFTALFDNYRIVKVLYRWVLRRDPNQTITNPSTYPRIMWMHDFNDSPISTFGELRQAANLREAFFNENNTKTKWYTLKPATLGIAYQTSIPLSTTSPVWGKWLDTRYAPSVPYYGIKYGFDGLFVNANIMLEAKFVMEFKGVQ